MATKKTKTNSRKATKSTRATRSAKTARSAKTRNETPAVTWSSVPDKASPGYLMSPAYLTGAIFGCFYVRIFITCISSIKPRSGEDVFGWIMFGGLAAVLPCLIAGCIDFIWYSGKKHLFAIDARNNKTELPLNTYR